MKQAPGDLKPHCDIVIYVPGKLQYRPRLAAPDHRAFSQSEAHATFYPLSTDENPERDWKKQYWTLNTSLGNNNSKSY